MSSFWDTVGDAASSGLKSVGSNVTDYLKTNVTEAFVRVGAPPTGNLTAAQIAAGQTGANPNSGVPASTAAAGSIANAGALIQQNAMPIMLAVGGLIALALILKKR